MEPEFAFASMAELGDSPYFCVYNKDYDTTADLTNNSNSFTTWMRSNVKASVSSGSYSPGLFIPSGVEISGETYNGLSYFDYWTVTQYQIGDMSSWTSTSPVGCLMWMRENEPLSAGSALRFVSNENMWQTYRNSSGTMVQKQLTIDKVNVWCAQYTYSNSLTLCTYDEDSGCWYTPIKAKYFFVPFVFMYLNLNVTKKDRKSVV